MSEAGRPVRSRDELRDASDHLFYEVWMLDCTARVLGMGVFGEGPARNAFLESFTIHARGLLQFFYPPTSPRRDDMLATDFVLNVAEWESARGPMPQLLASVSARVGKEVAHLTYGRLLVTQDTKPWSFVDVAEEISRIAGVFRSLVPDDLLGPRWHARRDA
jgi:hypothetical protein